MPRMRILTTAEHSEFDSPPVFTSVERKKYFHVPQSLEATLAKLRAPVNQVGFLLALGYFRATKRFFSRRFHQPDAEFVARRFGLLPEIIDYDSYEKSIYSRHCRMILNYLGFRQFDSQARDESAAEIRSMVRSQLRPKLILLRTIEILESRKTEIPSLFRLTELVTSEMRHHKEDLTKVIDAQLSQCDRELLDALLQKHVADESANSNVHRFRLTLLKKVSQSTKPSKIKTTVDDLRTLQTLFGRLEPIINSLDLTQEGMRYFANSVLKSRAYQVSRRADEDRHLHLLCFIAHQVFRVHDTLIDVLLTVVQRALNACQNQHREQYYDERIEHRQTVKRLVESAERAAFNPLAEIEAIVFSDGLSDTQKIGHVQDVLSNGRDYRADAAQQVSDYNAQSRRLSEDADYFDILESNSVKLQNRVAEIVKTIEFQGREKSDLMEAIQHYKDGGGGIGDGATTKFLSEAEQQAVRTDEKLRVSLYKALLFVKITEAIKSGSVNLTCSYKYRSLDDYLIPKATWEADRCRYLQRAGLADWDECELNLRSLAANLDQQYRQTNSQILNENNPHFHSHKDGTFHVSTPKREDEDGEPLTEPPAAFGNFLFNLFSMKELLVMAKGNRLGEFVGTLNFVKLFFYCLTKFDTVDVPENEISLWDLSKLLQSSVQRMLL